MLEDVKKDPSGVPKDADSVGHLESQAKTADSVESEVQSKEEFVARQTYLKTLNEAKTYKSKFQELMDEVEGLKQGKLEAEGNKDQLIDSLKSKLQKVESERNGLAKNFVQKSLRSQFETEALKHGIRKPDLIHNFVNYNDFFDSVDTETFSIDGTEVNSVVEGIKEQIPELFTKPSPRINNRTPSFDTDTKEKKKDFTKMTKEEVQREIERIDKLEGKKTNFING